MAYDLAVIGLGPGGLAAALQAAKAGKKVVAFTDRTHYVRQQRMSINRETINFLKEFYDEHDPDDVKFFKRMDNELYGNRSLIQPKDVETYLLRKLEKFSQQHPELVTIVKSDKKNRGPNTLSRIGKEPNAKHYLETVSGGQYTFNHLLAADGSKHGTATMVERDLGKKMTYTPFLYQEKNKLQAAVQLQLKPGVSPKKALSKPDVALNSQMKAFRELGWEEDIPPHGYVFTNESRNKFSFAGEIPEHIYSIQDEVQQKEALQKWASCHIAAHYGIRPEDLQFKTTSKKEFSPKLEDKIKIQATSFEMELVTSDEASILLDEDTIMGHVGDARRPANFYLGHGLIDAVAGGIAFADCIKANGEFDQSLFNAKIKNIDANVNLAMKARTIAWQQQDLNYLINKIQQMFPDDRALKTELEEQKKKVPKILSPAAYDEMKNEVTQLLLNKLLALCQSHASYLQNIKDNPSKKTMGLVIDDALSATNELVELIEEGRNQNLPAQEILMNFKKAVSEHQSAFKDNQSTAQEKEFYSKILQASGVSKSITNEFKKNLLKNSPANYNLTEESKEKLVEKLKRFVTVQEKVTKETLFGPSNSEKIEAANVLIQALDKNNTESVDLVRHQSVLRDGPLGSLIREHLKSISGKNSVIGFIEDLHSKMPAVASNMGTG